jgi:hypothetical protein
VEGKPKEGDEANGGQEKDEVEGNDGGGRRRTREEWRVVQVLATTMICTSPRTGGGRPTIVQLYPGRNFYHWEKNSLYHQVRTRVQKASRPIQTTT